MFGDDERAVYQEIRSIAHALMAREPDGHTLQPTAIVHEAYLRLSEHRKPWADRESFIAAASVAMRRVLVDYARHRRSARRDVGRTRSGVDLDVLLACPQGAEVFELAQLIDELSLLDARQASIADMRLFGQLSIAQIARRLGVSDRTVELDWRMARAWLLVQLRADS